MAIELHSSSSSPSLPTAKKAGGWRAIKYILGNESFEKLASMSLISNMTVYLTTKYNLEGVFLVNVVTIWSGSSNISSLAGAFVSDAFLGRFLTLLLGSMSSLLGMFLVTLTASIHQLRPTPCRGDSSCQQPQRWQLAWLFVGLTLLATGAGGIRPCNIAFGADQFDLTTVKGRAQLESFFNWWYFSFTIALLIALTGVVYIQTNISWIVGFAIPTFCLALSIAIFLMGRHTYIFRKPQGSVFVDFAKVIVASYRKRKLPKTCPTLDHSLYDPPLNNQESEPATTTITTKLSHTDRFIFLDKAAVIANGTELDSQGLPRNGWRLCSVHQIEQMKCLLGILPVWFSGIGCFLVMDQQSTFGVLQAIQMDASIGKHFKIPPGWMGVTSMLALSLWIFIYEHVYASRAKKLLKSDSRLTMKQRIRTGIFMSILCMVSAGIVEKRRRESALGKGTFESPMSVSMLLPQFVLSGLTEAFSAVAVMEFFTTQMPEGMRTVAGSIFFLSLSVASYLNALIVNIIHRTSGNHEKSPWVGGHDLNKNRLEYYYFLIAALSAINLVYFSFFASNYVYGGNTAAICSNSSSSSEETELQPQNLHSMEPEEQELGR